MENRKGFAVLGVDWKYETSEALSGGVQPRLPLQSGVEALSLTCNSCGHTWSARRFGEGSFLSNAGAVHLTCPACGQEGDIQNSELPHK